MLRQVLGYFDIRTSNIPSDRLVHEAVQMKNFAGVSLMGHIQCFAGLAAALLSVLCRPGYNVLVGRRLCSSRRLFDSTSW